jgi:putative tryptophan/tyrosine transport system substrate-binding protein
VRRREFIAGIAGAMVLPIAAGAQQPERMRRIGVLLGYPATDTTGQAYLAAFIEGLRQAGWTEGRNLRIDLRWNPGEASLAQTYAAQLIRLMPDVILVSNTLNLAAIRQATSTVPVVFTNIVDPVAQGIVANVRRPGGMVTGFSQLELSLASNGWTC